MGRLTEFLGCLAGDQPHGRHTHLSERVAAGGSRPRTRPGPLEATYNAEAVPSLVQGGGFDFKAGLPKRLQLAGTLTRLIVRMRYCYDSNDRAGFDKLIARHDSLFADLDDKPGDISAMGAEVRSICFPRWCDET